MAKKIFEVEISNRGPRGYETAALLKMPATWGEFNDALQKARIEDGRCCQNELTRIEYPGIQREMIGDNVDLYELNLLAQRLSELSKDDQMGMDGLLQIEKIHSTGPISLPRLINLTFNADICLLAPQVSNTQELGALLYEGEMLSDEAMALLDTTEPDSQFQNALLGVFGQKHQEDFDGVFTSQGYVEPGDEFKEVYRRGEIAPYFDHSGAPVVLEVSKGYFDDPGYRVWDDEALGRFVLENLERPSPEAVPFLNAEQVGAAYREQDKGIFCQGHYIRKSSLTIPMPETSQLLQPAVGDYAIRVRLASRENMDGVWVGFPDTGDHMDATHPDELLLGLDELHAETLSECIVLEVDCCLPQLEDIPDQYASAGELVRHAIDFGYAWAERGQGEPHWLDKWQAVLELEDCHRLDQALDYAQNLRQYAFVPRGLDLAEYGRELAVRDGVIPKSGLLAECFDCRAYAEAYMNQHGLSATDHGYVAWNGGEIYYEYSQPEQSASPSMSM